MPKLKVRKVGNSLGVVLPKEVIKRLRMRDGDAVFLIETRDGDYRLTACDPAPEEKMAKAEKIMGRYHNTLRTLAE
jgi:putative addiction module antidote